MKSKEVEFINFCRCDNGNERTEFASFAHSDPVTAFGWLLYSFLVFITKRIVKKKCVGRSFSPFQFPVFSF